jgi:hypothetical protein
MFIKLLFVVVIVLAGAFIENGVPKELQISVAFVTGFFAGIIFNE